MRILVTGGAGFIGSNLINSLLADGHYVINIDNLDNFYDIKIKEQNIQKNSNNASYKFIELDIRNLDRLKNLVYDDIDVIIHLAAKAGVRPSLQYPIEYSDTNVKGTQNMLEFANYKSVKKFIFASSSSVYGNNINVPWSESDSVLPISPYACTKLSGELLGHVYSHLYNIEFTALRFFTVYGPGQRPDLAIHKFTRLIYEDKHIEIYGDGESRRDYTYIDDVINGIKNVLYTKLKKFEVINIGNNKTIQLLELISLIEIRLKKKANIKYVSKVPGDVEQTWADISKAEKLIKYKTSFDINTGLDNFIEWFLSYSI